MSISRKHSCAIFFYDFKIGLNEKTILEYQKTLKIIILHIEPQLAVFANLSMVKVVSKMLSEVEGPQ